MIRPGLAVAAGLLCAGVSGPVPRASGPGPQAPRCVAPPPVTDVASLLAQGRFWHASRVARAPAGTRPRPAAALVAHIRIAEGLRRYDEVDELVARARGGDSVPAFLELAARADERAERWRSAEARYRRLLDLPETPEATRALAAARLAVVLEAGGRADSAAAAWRRAALEVPELADWFGMRRAALQEDTAVAFAMVGVGRSPGALLRGQLFVAERRQRARNLEGAGGIYRRLGRRAELLHVEYGLGRRREARALADSLLLADPRLPTPFQAATFLTAHYEPLSLRELLGISRAYAARGERSYAERFVRQAIARSDTSVEAWLELAELLSRGRRHPQALVALDSAAARARPAGARMVARERVRALLAAGRYGAADSLLARLVRSWSGDTTVARTLLVRADRHRFRGETGREQAVYLTLMRRFPDAPASLEARLRYALLRYAAEAPDEALRLVSRVWRADSNRSLGLAPEYWRARIAWEQGDTIAAVALRRLARVFPLSYYGVRSRELLGDTSFLVDSALALPRPGSFPPARARARVRLLASLGFGAEARAEALGWLGDSTVSVQLLLAVAREAGDAGFARESIALGEAIRRRAGMVPGAARALYPLPHGEVFEAEAAEHCVDPLLLAAIVRQESRFDAAAVSRAGARGMSQVLPSTGREMAARLRMGPWDPDLLFVPDYNLHLGARYLDEHRRRDSLPVLPLLAAYNAGRARVLQWRRRPGFDDPDLFAERVPIAETNNYVRVVYGSYVWYQYAWPPPAPRPEPPPDSLP